MMIYADYYITPHEGQLWNQKYLCVNRWTRFLEFCRHSGLRFQVNVVIDYIFIPALVYSLP